MGDGRGDKPLHYALGKNYTEVAMALIDKGADVNASNNNGDKPLHRALSNGLPEVAMALIEKGADIACMNNDVDLLRAVEGGLKKSNSRLKKKNTKKIKTIMKLSNGLNNMTIENVF